MNQPIEFAQYIYQKVSQQRLRTPEDYIDYLKKLSKRIQQGPLDFLRPNTIRRIIQIIRNKSLDEGLVEKDSGLKELGTNIKEGISLQRQSSKSDQNDQMILNHIVLPSIEDVISEMEEAFDDINKHAPQHFFTNEVIMVYDYSKTVCEFIKSTKKDIEIIIVQNETSDQSEIMRSQFKNATMTPFSNAFAIMQRVNKILIGVDAILKDGGILAFPGAYAISVAAKQFSVPVIILSTTQKLTPKYAFDQNTYNKLLSPLEIVNHEHYIPEVSYIGITYDYIPKEYDSILPKIFINCLMNIIVQKTRICDLQFINLILLILKNESFLVGLIEKTQFVYINY
ncbi:hypothetical protein pb186bvf_004220 [Paramecium bursaria]